MAKMRQIQVLMLRLMLMTALVLLLLSPFLLPRLHLPPSASLLKPQAPLPLSQTPAPPQQKTKEHHPVYDKSCYKYHANLTAENICCRTTNFSDSVSVIHNCIIEANTHLLNKERSNSTGAKDGAVVGGNAAGGGGTAGRSEQWSIFGDSHMRYLFASFLTRFRSPTLQYRLNAGEWLNGTERETFLHVDKLWHVTEMRDVKINFRMNYNFDKLLKRLPNKMAEWEENRPRTPTLVILVQFTVRFIDIFHFTVRFIDIVQFTVMFIDIVQLTVMFIVIVQFSVRFTDIVQFTLSFIDIVQFTLKFIVIVQFILRFIDFVQFTLMFIDIVQFTVRFIDIVKFTVRFIGGQGHSQRSGEARVLLRGEGRPGPLSEVK
ncbi:uncharacterized protein [Cherax quadricarinatus]|uniref:uncharacterized protein n=1 Tax=Cherax quadricarinatus TaxID=27406 RepID=UPI00387E6D9F